MAEPQTTNSSRRLTTSLPGAGEDRQDTGSDVGGASYQTTPVPVGDYEIVVVRPDTSTYTLGLFQTEGEAMEYAMARRSSLGIARSVSWHIARRISDDRR